MRFTEVLVVVVTCSTVLGLEIGLHSWKNLSRYLESVVNYQCRTNSFKMCNIWINETTFSEPFKDIADTLLGSVTFQSVPRAVRSLQSIGMETVVTYPLVFVNQETDDLELLGFWDVKFIVLGGFHHCDEVRYSMEINAEARIYDVVFMSTSVQLVCYYKSYCNEILSLREYPAPEKLFPDQSQDLCGHTVIATSMLDTELKRKVNGTLIGPDINWLTEVTKRINASIQTVAVDCEERYWHPRCLGKLVYHQGRQADIILDQIMNQRIGLLKSVEPYSFSIFVPRGRQLTPMELFIAPFQLSLWIFLASLVLGMKLLELVCPSWLRKGFTCSTIFGFADINNLKDIPRSEIIVSVILNVLLFFLLRAYETKIVSTMINTPHQPTIESLQQLINANLTIKADSKNFGGSFWEDAMGSWKEHIQGDVQHLNAPLDGVSAYCLKTGTAHTVVLCPRNVDPETRLPRYVPLDEKVVLTFGFYLVPNSILLDRLGWAQRMLFESGVRQHWIRDFMEENYSFED